MLKPYLLSVFIPLLTAGSALAQQLPAAPAAAPAADYLVTERGDTLRGHVEVPFFASEHGVTFSGPDGRSGIFLPKDTRAFGLADGRRYVRRGLQLSTRQQVNTRILNDRRDSVYVFLQQLTTGKAQLYRLQYGTNNTVTAMQYSQKETVFFLIETPGKGLTRLEQPTFRATLQLMFDDCPDANELLAKGRFDENNLVRIALGYSYCVSQGPALDLRPRAANSPRAVPHLSLRAGVLRSGLRYPDSYYLSPGEVQPRMGLTLGAHLRWLGPSAHSFTTGLQYARRASNSAVEYVVPLGYANQGETLTLRGEREAQTIQLPTGYVYNSPSRWGWFATAQLAPGLVLDNQTSLGKVVNVPVPGQTYPPRAGVSSELVTTSSGMTLLIGGNLSIGLSPRLGESSRWRPLVELQYELGRQFGDKYTRSFSYRGLGLSVGVEF